MIKRRQFIAGVAGAAAWPLAGWAQQPARMRRIGVLSGMDENDPEAKRRVSAFTQALADLGWTEGRNVRTDFRWGDGDIDRMRAIAQELVGRQPDIIVTNGNSTGTVALQRETQTIPIVFVNASDRVASGIVARLDRPGGNVTGLANLEVTLGGKWLELLSEIAPGLKRAAIMFDPDTISVSTFMPSFETAARSLKVVPITAPVHSDQKSKPPSQPLGGSREAALISPGGAFMVQHRGPIILAASRNNVPAVYIDSPYARDGGLLSYGPDFADIFRRSAAYVDRILRRAKPADLPVQFPTKFETAVNLKTAKALGLTVPQSILLSADEVIE